MLQTQLLLYALEERFVERVAEVARGLRQGVQSVQKLEACRNLLRRGQPTLLILRLGRHLEAEIALLEEVALYYPDTYTLVVGDTDHRALAALAWDLGAGYVLFPPTSSEQLLEIVERYLSQPSMPLGST